MKYPTKKVYRTTKVKKTAKLARYGDGSLAILLNFPPSFGEITKVKTLPGHEYHKAEKVWSCDASIAAIDKLIYFKFQIDSKLAEFYRILKLKQIPKINPKGLKKTLLEFQQTGIGFLDTVDGRGMIADDMGLGKTVQVLGYLEHRQDLRPALIVSTKSTKLNWETEAHNWLSWCDTEILSGKPSTITCEDIVIINYDILSTWENEIKKLKPKIIIVDECQKVKNPDAERTKALVSIVANVPHFIALSGTPIENAPIEIFNTLNIINPRLFPNRWAFGKKYCNGKNNGFGWEFKGISNEQELFKLLQNVMIRRLKHDVLKELPDKRYSIVPLPIDNRKEYDHAHADVLDYVTNKALDLFEQESKLIRRQLKSNLGIDFKELMETEKEYFIQEKLDKTISAKTLVQIGILKQLAAFGKLQYALDWIDTFLESKKKLVVFAHHKFIINALMQYFPKGTVKIDGSTSDAKRKQAIELFQNDPKTKLIVISEAAAEGITLTAASDIAILEFPWVPAKLDQIIDRVHRIGQLKNVIAHFLVAENTVEYKFAVLLDKKRKMINKVMDGTKVDPEQLLAELIKNL